MIELDNWIERSGMSHDEVACAAGKDPAHVKSLFESSEPNPGLEMYLALAHAAGAAYPLAPRMTTDEVGCALKTCQERARINNSELARRIGRDRSQVSRVLSGAHKTPRLDLVDAIVEGLGARDEFKFVPKVRTQARASGASSQGASSRAEPRHPGPTRFRVFEGDGPRRAKKDPMGGDSKWTEHEREWRQREAQRSDADAERARKAENEREQARADASQLRRDLNAEKERNAKLQREKERQQLAHDKAMGRKRFGAEYVVGALGAGVLGTVAALAWLNRDVPPEDR